MPHETLQPDRWEACPAGELERFARRQRARRQTQRFARAGAAAALVLICVTSYFALLARFAPPESGFAGGIACQECDRLLPAYHTHTLDAQRAGRVREHLAHCRKCHDHYLELFGAAHSSRSHAPRGNAHMDAPRSGGADRLETRHLTTARWTRSVGESVPTRSVGTRFSLRA